MPRRPNILLITSDTQRTDSIGAYGSPAASSPHLDRLAAAGVLFEQCHSPHPVCGPARSCLLTGQYAVTGGALENGIERRPGTPTFVDALAAQHYHTIMVGKTHFGPCPTFDQSYILAGEKNQDRTDFYADHIRALGFSRASAHPNPIPDNQFVDAYCISKTIDCLDAAPAEKPWFAFCSLLSPHAPLDPPQPWADTFRDRPLPDEQDCLPRLADEAEAIRYLLGYTPEHTGRAARDRHARELYYGLCSYVDDQIGRLLHWLDESGQAEDTLVIFSSDHGETHFADGYCNKHVFRPGSWRVPLICRWPGVIPAGSKREFASWTDITASILARAGCDVQWPQGFDLITPLCQSQENPRQACVGSLGDSLALATREWTFEWHPDNNERRLFNRQEDPWELHDLSSDPSHQQIQNHLFNALASWRALICDQDDRHRRISGGGPVAKRVVDLYSQRGGTYADQRLQELLQT